ncbi:MAG: hypothetical protein ACI92E_000456 [Oceanicoccus sp.]|jgi:hypothetical protein
MDSVRACILRAKLDPLEVFFRKIVTASIVNEKFLSVTTLINGNVESG